MEFNTALRIFRRISKEAQDILPTVSGRTASVPNLEDFHLYWEDKDAYLRKQRHSWPSSEKSLRREKYVHHNQTPEFREKQRVYQYLKSHPDATVVPPRQSETKQPRKYKKSSFTQYITVTSKEDPRAYQRQYQWFKNHQGKTVYLPAKVTPGRPRNGAHKTIGTQT
jgi:hypothetical protein